MQNDIPVTGPKTQDRKPETAPDTLTEPDAAEVTPVEPQTIRVESSATDAKDEDAVQGQVTLAVKVTKKRTPTQRDAAATAEYSPRYATPTRRPSDKRPASFNPLAWVADGVTGALEEARHNDLGLSQEFWKHLYAVRRESLLTARALVESLIAKVESTSDQQEEREQRRQRRGTVDIDF